MPFSAVFFLFAIGISCVNECQPQQFRSATLLGGTPLPPQLAAVRSTAVWFRFFSKIVFAFYWFFYVLFFYCFRGTQVQ
jgi:hypothetical protein